MDVQELIPQLTVWGIEWGNSQRALHWPSGRSLTDLEKSALDRFFDAATLDSARIKWVPLIPDPFFYSHIRRMYPALPLIPFSNMSGITFNDTILLASRGVYHDPPALGLLFHELVHVVQYEVLGVRTFIDRYVRGYFERGLTYEGIPLESHAFRLQAQYEGAPPARFSVRFEVQQRSGSY